LIERFIPREQKSDFSEDSSVLRFSFAHLDSIRRHFVASSTAALRPARRRSNVDSFAPKVLSLFRNFQKEERSHAGARTKNVQR
jgi:hypothetical protein